MADRILVVDDDPDIRSVVQIALQFASFEVHTAGDGTSALDAARASAPDLVVLDVMMPGMDGMEVVRELRADARLSHIPVVLLTAKAQLRDRIAGLEGGADDYVTKPFNGDELVARVHSALRRSRATGSLSPLTGLPGNVRIEQELRRRVAEGEPVALLYADVNHFKSFNDRYDFLRGDELLTALARLLRDAAAQHGDADTFVGHIGGDDFVVVTRPQHAQPIAETVVLRFDELVPGHYAEEDRSRGYVEVQNRQGELERFPLATISIGVVRTGGRRVDDHRALVETATEMKRYAKNAGAARSNYAVNRRTE